MNKSTLKSLWMTAWGMAMIFAQMTKTKADDNLVSAFSSEEMFEEFWSFLQEKGWVKGSQIVATKKVRTELGLPETKNA